MPGSSGKDGHFGGSRFENTGNRQQKQGGVVMGSPLSKSASGRPEPQAPSVAAAAPGAASAPSNPPGAMSSQMQAVVRLMAGQEERTIAEKLADPNRPTWEQYKKTNQDKLDISGLDKKKMEEYRRHLDEERDKILSRGRNRASEKDREKKKKKKSSSKKSKRKRSSNESDDNSESSNHSDNSSTSSNESRRKKRHKKHDSHKHNKHRKRDKRKSKSRKEKRKHRKEHDKEKGEEEDAYRLSSFFNNESDSDES